jgi:hypothetical protein
MNNSKQGGYCSLIRGIVFMLLVAIEPSCDASSNAGHASKPKQQRKCFRSNKPRTQDRDKTYLAVGQDLYSIHEYVDSQQNFSVHERMKTKSSDLPWSSWIPNALMVYTDVQTLRGLDSPADYGSGVEYANGLLELLNLKRSATLDIDDTPTFLQIGLWLNGTRGCRDIVAGKLDENLRRFFAYLESILTRHLAPSAVLRIGYEFDNPQFDYFHPYRADCHHADVAPDCVARANAMDVFYFREAFKYIVTYIRRNLERSQPVHCNQPHLDIIFVWHSWAAGLPADIPVSSSVPSYGQHESVNAASGSAGSSIHQLSLGDFYPGDDFVDWIGVSIFRQYEDTTTTDEVGAVLGIGNPSTLQSVVDFANSHKKRILIAESTPFGGIANLRIESNRPLVSDRFNNPWERWFQPVLQFIRENDVAMWSYINCNWDTQPMWRGVGFGDTRLSTNETVMRLWQTEVLENRRFLSAISAHTYSTNNPNSKTSPLSAPTWAGGFHLPFLVPLAESSTIDEQRKWIMLDRKRKPLCSLPTEPSISCIIAVLCLFSVGLCFRNMVPPAFRRRYYLLFNRVASPSIGSDKKDGRAESLALTADSHQPRYGSTSDKSSYANNMKT